MKVGNGKIAIWGLKMGLLICKGLNWPAFTWHIYLFITSVYVVLHKVAVLSESIVTIPYGIFKACVDFEMKTWVTVWSLSAKTWRMNISLQSELFNNLIRYFDKGWLAHLNQAPGVVESLITPSKQTHCRLSKIPTDNLLWQSFAFHTLWRQSNWWGWSDKKSINIF